MMRRLAPLFAVLALLLGFRADAAAQNVCDLVYQTGDWVSVGAEGQRVINASGPLLVRCANGEELRSDSAVIYEAINEVHLFRRVDYQDPTRSLTSDYATYNGNNGRLWATGNVVFTDKNRGSTLRGPNLEYYRAGQGRPDAQAIATERPHLTVVPRRREGARQRDPMEVDADRITTVGEKFVTAEGNVVIEGKEMDAWGQEAYYDADAERMELRRNARAKGETYELTGDYIESELNEGALERVLSRGNARLVEERLRVTGPQLQLFFARDSLQRLVSGKMPSVDSTQVQARSVALARGFRMEADSLEALTPGQKIRRVTAIGTAEGQAWDTAQVAGPAPADTSAAAPDSVAGLALGERDLIYADTIIGFFKEDTVAPGPSPTDSARAAAADPSVPVARPDTARSDSTEAQLERMLAFGGARSLYRMRPSREQADSAAKMGINYVIADTIDLSFLEGEVDIATVRGLKKGVYLDPLNADSARADTLPRDSAQVAAGGRRPAAPDSVAPTTGQGAGGNAPAPRNSPATTPATPANPAERRPAPATTPPAPGGRP
jgi:lipopolysaccharide export system protein LptA